MKQRDIKPTAPQMPEDTVLIPFLRGIFLNDLRKSVFERDLYRCRHCGTHTELTVDHIIPESKGGKHSIDNMQTLCHRCNCIKGTNGGAA